MKRIVALTTGMVFLLALAAFAGGVPQGATTKTAQTKAAPAMTTHQATGIIDSVAADKLVLARKVKGKDEKTTFTLNDQTQKPGDLKAGERVTIHYMIMKGHDIATQIAVNPPKTIPKK
jgi:hypothetical protein